MYAPPWEAQGNMTCQQNAQTNGLCPQYSFSASTNQITNSGYTYDASGDLTNDGTHAYKYDAEARLISVDNGSTASYVYNALGERVEKDLSGTYTEYAFDKDGNPEAENNRGTTNNGWVDSWINFEGQHLAHYENNGVYYIYSNQVGTAGFVTDWTGAIIQDELHYPWGQAWTMMGTQTEERFASLHHRDAATNLDPTHFRMYSSDEGRWLTPDPAQADIYNPQSMSRYAYAAGNPFGIVDPTGACGGRWQVVKGIAQCVAAVALGAGCLAGDVSTSGLATGLAVVCVSSAVSVWVQGTVNVVGGLTGTNVDAAEGALQSVGTLPGIYVAANSGGNLTAGAYASAAASFASDGYNIINDGGPLSYGGTLVDLGVQSLDVWSPPTTVNVYGTAPQIPLLWSDDSSQELVGPGDGGGGGGGGGPLEDEGIDWGDYCCSY